MVVEGGGWWWLAVVVVVAVVVVIVIVIAIVVLLAIVIAIAIAVAVAIAVPVIILDQSFPRSCTATRCRASCHTLQGPGCRRQAVANVIPSALHCRASPHAAGPGVVAAVLVPRCCLVRLISTLKFINFLQG